MKIIYNKIRNDFEHQRRWFQMSEIDRRIKRAERDLVRAHALWQSLLAAKEAENRSIADTEAMVRDVYSQRNFEELQGEQ
jgi:cellobiose-specific phosphotransferase system component IIA